MKTIGTLNRRTFLSTGLQATTAVCWFGSSRLVRAGKGRAITVPAEQLHGLAVSPRGQMVVAADSGVCFFNLEGELQRKLATDRPVRAVSFDSQERLFIAFKDQTARVSKKGELEMLGRPMGGGTSALTSLAVADGGDIYAADSGAKLVWRLDADGKVLQEIKPAEGAFSVPRGFFPIAWHDGQLVIAEPGRHQIHSYGSDGRLQWRWGERTRGLAGFSGCCNPVSVVALADGTILTAERGQPRVKAFDAAGGLRRVVAGPEEFQASMRAALAEAQDLSGCQAGLFDLATLPGGEIIVLDRTTREVRVLG